MKLYHATLYGRVKKIKRLGLRPPQGFLGINKKVMLNPHHNISDTRYIYLYKNKQDAETYARYLSKINKSNKEYYKPAVLEVDTGLRKLNRDKTISSEAYKYMGDISPRNIKLILKGGSTKR